MSPIQKNNAHFPKWIGIIFVSLNILLLLLLLFHIEQKLAHTYMYAKSHIKGE